VTENSAKKQRGAPFRKGQSGNPSGKPKGARNRTTVLAEKLMQDDARDIVQAVSRREGRRHECGSANSGPDLTAPERAAGVSRASGREDRR
jgi:hypothetical protein